MIKSVENLKLSKGSHSGTYGACVMELVSYLANEPWSDHPQCASKSITNLAIWINDTGDQTHRDILQELAGKIINTSDWKKEPARAKLYSKFALWCSKEAAKYAKYAAAESAAKYAEYAAKYAEYAAESAAKSAKYAEYAAEFRQTLYKRAIETLVAAIEVQI